MIGEIVKGITHTAHKSFSLKNGWILPKCLKLSWNVLNNLNFLLQQQLFRIRTNKSDVNQKQIMLLILLFRGQKIL